MGKKYMKIIISGVIGNRKPFQKKNNQRKLFAFVGFTESCQNDENTLQAYK